MVIINITTFCLNIDFNIDKMLKSINKFTLDFVRKALYWP